MRARGADHALLIKQSGTKITAESFCAAKQSVMVSAEFGKNVSGQIAD